MNLSDRVRANSEAAPWVVEAIKELEQQLAEREKQIVMLQEALLYMHYEKCNYMAINHLGDPLKETAARIALKALDATQDLSGLVLCDAEVNDWDDDVPLYRRKQP